jgi:hypothetical protein
MSTGPPAMLQVADPGIEPGGQTFDQPPVGARVRWEPAASAIRQ